MLSSTNQSTNHWPITIKEILSKTDAAFQKLFSEDAALFIKGLHEQTVTFRLGIHLQRVFSNHVVDCEYNRKWDDPKRLSSNRLIKPDLIVHKRLNPGDDRTKDNLFALEAKKHWYWKRSISGLESRIRELTAAGPFHYKLGLCWRIVPTADRSEHKVRWIRNGTVLTEASLADFTPDLLRLLR